MLKKNLVRRALMQSTKSETYQWHNWKVDLLIADIPAVLIMFWRKRKKALIRIYLPTWRSFYVGSEVFSNFRTLISATGESGKEKVFFQSQRKKCSPLTAGLRAPSNQTGFSKETRTGTNLSQKNTKSEPLQFKINGHLLAWNTPASFVDFLRVVPFHLFSWLFL